MKAGWTYRTLGEVCEVVNGGTPKTGTTEYWNGKHCWITPAEMGKRLSPYVSETERMISDLGLRNSSARMLPPYSVILSSRAPIGHLVINTEPMATNQGCKGLVPRSQLQHKFLYYYLSSIVDLLNSLGSGATFKELSGGKLKEIEIPLPPLPEQQRIVAVLDQAFDGIATAKANAEKNLKNAREIFESHLNAVFTQRGEGWVEKKLGVLYKIGSSKRVLKSEWKNEGVPFYRGREITRLAADGFVDNELFISEEHYSELSRKSGVPEAGDIVITAIGTIGNAHIVRDSDRFYFKDASVLWMKRVSDINSSFVNFWLKSPMFYEQLDKGNGATVDTLTIQKMQNLRLHVPSLLDQKKITDNLLSVTSETQRLESIYQHKLAALDELKKSLLHQAFTGELTAMPDKQLDEALT